MKTVLPVRQMLVRAVDKGVDGINYPKSTHVRLERPRREDVFMSKVANCCAEHGALSLKEKTLPVSTGDPNARVLWHQFPPVTRGLQLSFQRLRPWPVTTARSHRGGGIGLGLEQTQGPSR